MRELRREPALAASFFYATLFTKRPGLQPVFGAAFDHDGRRLLGILNVVVAGLTDPQRFLGLLTLFARPGVREHLDDRRCVLAIGHALQRMLEHHLAEFYTEDVRDAWQAAYTHVWDVVENGLVRGAEPARSLH
jgi:nitric oxide dioxygenase